MKARWFRALLILFGLVGLVFALRHDLGEQALRHGEARLRAGDIAGAEAALDQVVALGGDSAPLAFNLGISHYRKGEFAQARKWFDTAHTRVTPELRADALYNRGNSEFRLAQQLAATRPHAAIDGYRKAVTSYDESLVHRPDAADVSGNRALSLRNLATLEKAQRHAREPRSNKEAAPSREKGGQGADAKTAATRAQTDSPQSEKGKARQAETPDPSAKQGKSRRDLTRNEVERLLNDARGRERPMGMPHIHKQGRPLAQPDMDW